MNNDNKDILIKNGLVVKVDKVSKKFGQKIVLNQVSFQCDSKESLVILGESGTGKSVLMRIIGTLLDADSGSIIMDNTEIIGLSDKKKEIIMKKIGFLFQYCGLFEHLTIWENVAFRELFVKKINKKDAFDMAVFRLKQAGIKEEAYKLKPNMISGGMRRRVAMARTLMKEPALILLDEPTSGLDPIMSEVINDLIIETKSISNATIITITHDLNSAMKISDKILVLNKGNIIWQGKPHDICRAEHEYIIKFVKAANVGVC
jgi:phospholipid/cholesterol/gamma-HCH transport system ATP-binding protein